MDPYLQTSTFSFRLNQTTTPKLVIHVQTLDKNCQRIQVTIIAHFGSENGGEERERIFSEQFSYQDVIKNRKNGGNHKNKIFSLLFLKLSL